MKLSENAKVLDVIRLKAEELGQKLTLEQVRAIVQAQEWALERLKSMKPITP